MNRALAIFKVILKIAVLLYFISAGFYYLNRSEYVGGDESIFIRDLGLIHETGWIKAIEKNISIPYMLLSYPISHFFKFYLALRITNVVILIGFLYYLSRAGQKSDLIFYFLFFLASTGFFFYGTNDALFFYSLSVFLIETQNAVSGKKFSLCLALSTLIIAFFTRELFLVYLPVILIGVPLLWQKSNIKSNLKIPIILFTSLVIFNLPSLMENGRLSYDKKSPPKNIQATWPQRQYLAQLMVNHGDLEFQSHPSWQKTDDYLKKHGENSLPKGIVAGVFKDIKLTIIEFFKDLFYILLYHMRLLGFTLSITFLMAIRKINLSKKIDPSLFSPFATFIMICIFALIIISYVEMRWLASVFILSIYFYDQLEKQKIISNQLVLVNSILLIALSIYGSYGLISRIL